MAFQSVDTICIEDLHIGAMKELWGWKVSDLGFSSFASILEHVAQKEDKEVLKVDRYFSSSQTCSECGDRYSDLSLEERTWECRRCGSVYDRDLNAAQNVLERALSMKAVGGRRKRA